MKRALLTILLVLSIDQISKFWVKLNMFYDQAIPVAGNWFIINFIENPGMAFGLEFGGDYGKVILTLFRIVAVIGIGWYLYKMIQEKVSNGYIIALSLIFAGALGNIIDSAFYGVIFSESTHSEVATLFPPDGGYGTFLHGRVVDMLYFPLIQGIAPEWMPFIGGDYFIFFRPVFNIADSAISIGVVMILLFQRRYFK